MTQSRSAFVEHEKHQHTEAAHQLHESHGSHASRHDWHPDMSRERPEWRTAHARERGCHLPVDEHGRYTVKNGDTLFDIAIRLLKETNESTNAGAILRTVNDIARRNMEHCPELRDNPHLIQPGQVLRILADTTNALNIPRLSTDGVQMAPAPDENQLQPRFAPAPAPVESAPAPQVAPADVPPPQNAGEPVDDSQAPASAPADAVQVPTQVLPAPVPGDAPATPQPGEATVYAAPTPEQAYPASEAPDNSFYGTQDGASYMDQEARRLSSMMVNDPHRAAAELRDQIAQLDPRSAGMLISETKNDEIPGGLGDLQIQAEFDQYGRDTGLRNVTMATPDGVERIAELQSGPASYAGANPLGFVAGMVVGDLLWQQQHGVDFNDPQHRSWCNREQTRENYWNENNGQFVQNWKDQNYRNQFQNQNWQQAAFSNNVNNTFITNNRYDTTINNREVNVSHVNQTINNTTKYVDSHVPMSTDGHPIHRPIPKLEMPHVMGGNRGPQVRPQETTQGHKASDVPPAAAKSAQGPVRDKAFWANQAADADKKHRQAESSQTPEQAELKREMEAEQRQQAADRAKAANQGHTTQERQTQERPTQEHTTQAHTTEQAQPKWMDRVKGAQGTQGTQGTPEHNTSDAGRDKPAQPKQSDTASETAERTAKATQEHQKLVDAAREQQKQMEEAKQKAAAQPRQAAQPAVVIPQLVGVR
jgi:hypothetical protein